MLGTEFVETPDAQELHGAANLATEDLHSALDTALTGMPTNTTGAYLTFNMRGHIIAQGSYIGLFAR